MYGVVREHVAASCAAHCASLRREMVLRLSAGSAFSEVDEGWLVAKVSRSESAPAARSGDGDGDEGGAAKRQRSMPVAAYVQERIEQADHDANELHSRVRAHIEP